VALLEGGTAELTVALGLCDCVVEAVGVSVSLPVAVAVLLELGVPLPVGVLLAVLPRAWGLDMLALAQSGALLTGLCALLMLSPLARPQWPHLRDMIGIIAAVLVMIAATWPLRDLPAGIVTLSAQAGTGALVYALMVFAFDTAGLRRIALARLRRAGRSEIS
jgi:hypothetical protein